MLCLKPLFCPWSRVYGVGDVSVPALATAPPNTDFFRPRFAKNFSIRNFQHQVLWFFGG